METGHSETLMNLSWSERRKESIKSLLGGKAASIGRYTKYLRIHGPIIPHLNPGTCGQDMSEIRLMNEHRQSASENR
jgi:hypothetical protein